MTLSSFPDPLSGLAPNGDPRRLRDHWKGLVTLGAVSAVFGALALVLTVSATIASVLMIGVFMLVAGAAQVAVGFRMRTWKRLIAWELGGVLYLVAGTFAVLVPEIASVVITLMLGAGLVATGILRLVFGMQIGPSANRSLLFLSGAVTTLLGAIIVLGWPGNSAFILGTLLGIDLLFNGVTLVLFGLKARQA